MCRHAASCQVSEIGRGSGICVVHQYYAQVEGIKEKLEGVEHTSTRCSMVGVKMTCVLGESPKVLNESGSQDVVAERRSGRRKIREEKHKVVMTTDERHCAARSVVSKMGNGCSVSFISIVVQVERIKERLEGVERTSTRCSVVEVEEICMVCESLKALKKMWLLRGVVDVARWNKQKRRRS